MYPDLSESHESAEERRGGAARFIGKDRRFLSIIFFPELFLLGSLLLRFLKKSYFFSILVGRDK